VFDVLVIGGGLSGTVAAAVLARRGVKVALVDRNQIVPPSFRAEQLVGSQVEALRRLGVLDDMVAGMTPTMHAIGVRSGCIIGGVDEIHYGFHYNTLVNQARDHLPPDVTFMVDRVTDLQTGPERQRAALASGHTADARLVVVATGQERALVQQIGIGRRMVRAGHSLTIGLDLASDALAGARNPLMTCYPSSIRHRIDYLTAFPLEQTTRLNLFTYCTAQDAWVRSFRQSPRSALLEAFPDLESYLGPLDVAGLPQMRVTDLWMATGCVRNGLVLIGDAYQTTCPATGMGISRLLLDVERLCGHHALRWLAGDGVTADRITTFYDDPTKLVLDQEAMDAAEYQRSVSTETSWRWRIRRRQLALRQRIGGLIGGPAWLTAGFTFGRRPPVIDSTPGSQPDRGIPHVQFRPAVAEPQEPAAPHAVEIDSRRGRNTGLRQHPRAERDAVVGPVGDVGEQVERPFRR
jgi:2-polyprenyl-6-methoxyphenol hydroxylase-like FAD-dependent oxidoreductase